MVMRAKKNFIVVAYDIADDRRRSRVVKILTKLGIRVNYSVFECMITDAQFEKMQIQIAKEMNTKEDQVIYYPICVNCFTKIIYQPKKGRSYPRVVIT
jgi:CRISPR-associated protein Cas2